MGNLTIENINGFLKSSNIERILDHGKTIEEPSPVENPTESAAKTFADHLHKSIEDLNEVQVQADRAVKELVAGRNKNIHETMLMLEKADMSFKLAMQVRNKLVDAYREIMRMQV